MGMKTKYKNTPVIIRQMIQLKMAKDSSIYFKKEDMWMVQRLMKDYQTLLVIGEMQIIITVRSH